MKVRWDASPASAAEGVDLAISVWTTAERGRVSGQEMTAEREKCHEGTASAAKGRELGTRNTPRVFQPAEKSALPRFSVDTR